MPRLVFEATFSPVWALVLALESAAVADPGSAPTRTGRASDPFTGAFLYTEEHHEVRPADGKDPDSNRTVYRDPQGAVFAERRLDFSRHPWKPDYHLRDGRDGYEEGSETRGGKLRVFVRTERDEPLREKILEVPEPSVVDGGIGRFLRAHWKDLAAGKRLTFHIVAPARLDYFLFEAAQEPSMTGGAARTRTFVLRPVNKALRLLVDPIRVTYDEETRRLREYSGISNVNNERGKSFPVRVVYPSAGP